ncbi:MAG: MFS transporter [Pseudodesulfovibrio sp.]|nr:MFS transporter [Pseudodesulfovibrio aespoeensis]MBU4193081.1 MFS transporter [Pseudomonadota bacterium]MBV1765025.1 MFS transporter [Pseudodesulfovibrio sp.]MBU4244590.1 MFS transporter [Pseudomonadota bacterium]MBU4378865.1 MFS transporter [Pseudomonadota bacterium]MBU4475334.1 MFS transporter [Pseudomonadota bacterium]
MYIFLLVLVVGAQVGFQGWRTLFNNFAVEVGGLSGLDIGLIQSVREIPGFLSLLALYVIMIMSEHRLAALSVCVLGLGVALAGLMPTTAGLVFTTLLMSFGFHFFETMNQSLTLQYFSRTEAPLVLGRLRSVAALTNVAVGGGIYFLARTLGYAEMFAILGGVAVAAGLWAVTRDPSRIDIPPQDRKMVLKVRYWLYYALTFLGGARRQIFVAFAVFLLVERFGYTIEQVTMLFVANNVVNYFAAPLTGRAVNRFGERAVLSVEYAGLALIFLGYALIDSAFLAGALYVVNNVFYNFAMGIRTFYHKIADPGDIASGMAVGFTINHIAAVIIPLLGGLVWLVDYRAVFVGAAALSVASLVLSQFVDAELTKAGAKG